MTITHTITNSALDCLEALARMKERAFGQDGQVTILDLPKAHGIPYLEVSSLQPCTSQYFIVSKFPCITADGNFQSYLLSKGIGKGILFLWPGVLFGSLSKG